MNLVDELIAGFGRAQQWLFESTVQPLMFHLGLGNLLEDAYGGTGWLFVGLAQIAVMLTLIRGLELWRPVERVIDRRAVRTDVIYTLVHRLGLFRLALFFTVDPIADLLTGKLRMAGWQPWQLDALWPAVVESPLAGFLVYLVVFDLVDYLIHRGQHNFNWWWQLHALHHSQRQMTMWSDNRNHLIDDLLRDTIFVAVAIVVGIAPGQFVAVVAMTQLLESLSHANVRLSFGPLLGRLLVSPAYHRQHHAIGTGHESHGAGTLGGCNFSVLFPVWDFLFGTANLRTEYGPTGLRDQLPESGAREYGHGFWAQQWLGLMRLVGRA